MSDDFSPTGESFLDAEGWLKLIALSGADGIAWVGEYRARDVASVVEQIDHAVRLIHRQCPEEARRLLDASTSDAVESLRSAAASLRAYVDARQAAAAALYFYRLGDDAQVESMFRRRIELGARAIAEHDFLKLLGVGFIDIALQRAHVARKAYDWSSMARHVDIAWQMLESRRPLHVSDGGESLWFSDLATQLESLPLADEVDSAELTKLTDPRWRRARFRALVAESYALPWMIIPYD